MRPNRYIRRCCGLEVVRPYIRGPASAVPRPREQHLSCGFSRCPDRGAGPRIPLPRGGHRGAKTTPEPPETSLRASLHLANRATTARPGCATAARVCIHARCAQPIRFDVQTDQLASLALERYRRDISVSWRTQMRVVGTTAHRRDMTTRRPAGSFRQNWWVRLAERRDQVDGICGIVPEAPFQYESKSCVAATRSRVKRLTCLSLTRIIQTRHSPLGQF